MKWVVLAIFVFLVPYTYLTLHFRKPGKSFEPYHDMKERANTIRLLSAGFQRIALETDEPADALQGLPPAGAVRAPDGLPPDLNASLIERPGLPEAVGNVRAAASIDAIFSYPIVLTCMTPDDKHQLAGAALYVHGPELVVVLDFEALAGGLEIRDRESVIRVTVPAGALKPGSYRIVVAGTKLSQTWRLQVH